MAIASLSISPIAAQLDHGFHDSLKAISPRPDTNRTMSFATENINEATYLDVPKNASDSSNLNLDIPQSDPDFLPPVMNQKQFQRKASTRAWKFREILDDMNAGLFKPPSQEQLEKLWKLMDVDNNGILDRKELKSLIIKYIELCQVIAKKQIQRQQNVMRKIGGQKHRRMSQTLGKLASQTQVVCNQWLTKLHSNPDILINQLLKDLMPEDEKGEQVWTKAEFFERAPKALTKLKEALKMHEWSDRAAELLDLDEQQNLMNEEDEMDDDNAKKKKRLEGILTIKVVGALELKPDEGRELCSPYCILHVGNKKLPTIFLQNTNNPEWSQKFRFTRYRFKHGQSRQGTLYVMDWAGEQTGATLVGFADFQIPDDYVEDSQQYELVLKDNADQCRGYLTITLSLQKKRPDYLSYEATDSDENNDK